jgi:hypothetical protein
MKRILPLLLVVLATLLSGCIMAPVVSSIQESGLTESGRQIALNDAIKEFNSALFWQNYAKARTFALEENMGDLHRALVAKKEQGRVVDSKVEGINYTDDSYKAEVDVAVRVQNFSTMIVASQVDKQVWKFSIYDGWKLESISSIEG